MESPFDAGRAAVLADCYEEFTLNYDLREKFPVLLRNYAEVISDNDKVYMERRSLLLGISNIASSLKQQFIKKGWNPLRTTHPMNGEGYIIGGGITLVGDRVKYVIAGFDFWKTTCLPALAIEKISICDMLSECPFAPEMFIARFCSNLVGRILSDLDRSEECWRILAKDNRISEGVAVWERTVYQMQITNICRLSRLYRLLRPENIKVLIPPIWHYATKILTFDEYLVSKNYKKVPRHNRDIFLLSQLIETNDEELAVFLRKVQLSDGDTDAV